MDLRLLSLLTIHCMVSAFRIDDSLHFAIHFPTSELNAKEQLDDSKERILISTPYQEKYTCIIPTVEYSEQHSSREESNMRHAWKLLLALEGKCFIRHEAYWTYELCHGKYVKQYHEDKGQRISEYFLGNHHDKLNKNDDHSYIKYENEKMAVLPAYYVQGTTCDITGRPRSARVLYGCGDNEELVSIAEVASCEYDVILFTPILCSHPAFVRKRDVQHSIICTPAQGTDNLKPRSLIELNEYHKTTFKRGYSIGNQKADAWEEVEEGKGESAVLDSLYQQTLERSPYASHTEDTAHKVVRGDECIQGGSGWWRHQICFGDRVIQFHEDADGKNTILLGTFDADTHKSWLQNNPHKKPHKYGKNVIQVSHMYMGGDLCKETQSARSVEVRVRCIRDASGLAMTLTEPVVCQYILTVSGEGFCNALQTVDSYGLFQL